MLDKHIVSAKLSMTTGGVICTVVRGLSSVIVDRYAEEISAVKGAMKGFELPLTRYECCSYATYACHNIVAVSQGGLQLYQKQR